MPTSARFGGQPLRSVRIAKEALSEQRIRLLCDGGVPQLFKFFKLEGSAVKRQRVEERPGASSALRPEASSAAASTEHLKPEPAAAVQPAAPAQLKPEPVAQAQPAAPAQLKPEPLAQAQPAAPAQLKPEPVAQAQPAATDRPKPEAQLVASDARVPAQAQLQKDLEEAQKKREEAANDKLAKSILKRAGLKFNEHWQRYHKGHDCSGGHWKQFLQVVIGNQDATCRVCIDLVAKFEVDSVRGSCASSQSSGSQPSPQASPESAQASAAAEPQAMMVHISPPHKRVTRGRPPKRPVTEESGGQDFDLLTYLKEKRAGVYRFLDQAEAVSRLPKSKKKDFADIEKEMAKRPVQCTTCGIFFHLPCLTNSNAL